ncbi:IMPACT family protein [Microvirga pakistanensis]|uniref:IMPACT family protein n=1 Tax=Microvirga pakistanensis TaxID=1682650 RepID=UPI00106A13CF|nr:YigZ family protein [Microvirga pakistanensis]
MFTLDRTTSLEQIVKKSRFLAVAGPVASEQEAKAFIADHSHAGANHNCWAWRVGQSSRSSDDGEPGGTAGKPILQALDRLQVDRVAIVVSRWFGGVLLGSGGLVRAYGGTAAACLRASTLVEIRAVDEAIIVTTFSDLALVKARLAGFEGVHVRNESFTDTGAVITAALPQEAVREIIRTITDVTSGRARISLAS